MSARVLNPIALTELCKLGSPTAKAIRRNIPCAKKLNLIKRDLFGSPNPSETKKIFETEIEKHQEIACKRWGFDFKNGYPLIGHNQYIWEPVSLSSDFIPEMYTLSRAAHLREISNSISPSLIDSDGMDSEYSPDDILMDERAARQNAPSSSIVHSLLVDNVGSESTEEEEYSVSTFTVSTKSRNESHQNIVMKTTTPSNSTNNVRKRQKKITEFMKERKRLAPTPKKISPAKRAKSSPSSSASPASSIFASTIFGSSSRDIRNKRKFFDK